MTNPPKEYRQFLHMMLKSSGVAERAEALFVEWPEIEQIALQYVRFVSPWLIVDDKNVAEVALKKAFSNSDHAKDCHRSFPHRTLLRAIAESASHISSVRISVQNGEGLWEIWSYDEPLTAWMEKRGRSAIQIRRRDISVLHGPLLIKMLAYVSSTRDMELAEVSLPMPFEGVAA